MEKAVRSAEIARRFRHVAAAKAAAASRQAVAIARRTHLGRMRAMVQTKIEESYRRRQHISHALSEMRRGVTVFRSQLRKRSKESRR